MQISLRRYHWNNPLKLLSSLSRIKWRDGYYRPVSSNLQVPMEFLTGFFMTWLLTSVNRYRYLQCLSCPRNCSRSVEAIECHANTQIKPAKNNRGRFTTNIMTPTLANIWNGSLVNNSYQWYLKSLTSNNSVLSKAVQQHTHSLMYSQMECGSRFWLFRSSDVRRLCQKPSTMSTIPS